MLRGVVFAFGALVAVLGAAVFVLNTYAIGASDTGLASHGDRVVSAVGLGAVAVGAGLMILAGKVLS